MYIQTCSIYKLSWVRVPGKQTLRPMFPCVEVPWGSTPSGGWRKDGMRRWTMTQSWGGFNTSQGCPGAERTPQTVLHTPECLSWSPVPPTPHGRCDLGWICSLSNNFQKSSTEILQPSKQPIPEGKELGGSSQHPPYRHWSFSFIFILYLEKGLNLGEEGRILKHSQVQFD